jgi:CheY-like chemotaxis protein
VVDDDWISAEVAKLMLVELGFQVDLAVDGGQGLAMASATCYDLILMDCWMPVLSGSETTRALRASPAALSRNVPIIAVTANARESDAAECRDAGMNDLIVKPLLLGHLIEKLKLYLPAGPPHRG